MGAIDAYMAELGGALRGPRRTKADLLTEARDSLVDATEAYERRGLHRERAERRAVDEFGDVREIAPAFQTELGLSQGRRTALLLAFVVAPQHLVWDVALPMVVEPTRQEPSSPVFAIAGEWTSRIGTAALLGAVLAAVACGIGVRYVRPRPWLARATGIFACVSAGVLVLLGLLMTVLSRDSGSLLALTGLPWTIAFLVLPLAWVAVSARRCIAAA